VSQAVTLPSAPPVDGSYYQVQPGETLWRIARDFGWNPQQLARVNKLSSSNRLKAGQTLFIPAPAETVRFLWPARGTVSMTDASNRSLRINAPEGTLVRASRTGRVAVAAQQLDGFGKTVLLDHGDGYVTVYAGLDQILVSLGMAVRQGKPVGKLGREPLYFEIRQGARTSELLKLLP